MQHVADRRRRALVKQRDEQRSRLVIVARLEISARQFHACARETRLDGKRALQRENGLAQTSAVECRDTEQVVEIRVAGEIGLVRAQQGIGAVGVVSLQARVRSLQQLCRRPVGFDVERCR